MNLIIDIGNTTTKVAIFDGEELIKHQILNQPSVSAIVLFSKEHHISNSIISSVKQKDIICNELNTHFNALFFTHKTEIPISTNYNTPETLGKDRLAGIVGANKEYPNKNILVIDAGSCITFDFFMDCTYCGGRISPGVQMRYDALHTFTNQLPQISIANIGTIVTINAKTKIENIQLLNILGERVKFSNTNQINTSAFVKGTYIIRIKFSDGRLAENKLIIE